MSKLSGHGSRNKRKKEKMYFELCVVNYSCFWKAIHALTYFHIYIPIMNIILELLLFHNFLSDKRCFDAHVSAGVYCSV